jgi:glycerophosphoryl diester phosphodiesterase
VAHRGDVEEFPESTIPAFRSAVAKGAEMIELDEWRCKTGELVVMHDHSVDRTTNGKGRIADLTLRRSRHLTRA